MTVSTAAAMSRADYLRALVVVVIWGSNFVVMKLGLIGLNPMLLGALRFAAASLPWVFILRAPRLPWRHVAAYGLLQGLGQFGLLFTALQLGMPAGMASVVMQTQAFFTLLLAGPVLGERVQRHQALGLVLAAGGLVLIGAAHGEGPGQMTLIGFVLTVGAGLMWASSNLVVRLAGRINADYDPVAFIAWSSLMPVLPFLALSAWGIGAAATWQQLRGIGWTGLGVVLFLGWLATLLAYSLWTRLLKRHPVARVAPFSMLVPLIGLLAAWLAFGERLNLLQWIGTGAVMAGLVVNQLGARWLAAYRARH
ncbi:MAG: EamA family transporter [Leptothrix sp. (in: b-proteobacteria)]